MSAHIFDDLWNAATNWAEQQSALILAEGRPLTDVELATARVVGVLAPERIRDHLRNRNPKSNSDD
jgi:hypothetical protein